jgi:Ca2+:H+ antiporter
VLAPVSFLLRFVFHVGDVALFVSSALALVPLAWLIGEATEHAAHHTGPRIGGLLNASFGNAPEMIIALFAIADGLPDVVRGSLTGSVVSNLLLVLGIAMIAGGDGRLDRRSLRNQLALVVVAVGVFLVPAIPGFTGDPERHTLVVITMPVAALLLVLYVVVTAYGLRRHREQHVSSEEVFQGWTLRRSLVALAVATAATALVSEILVHSLEGFAETAGFSEFFISTVIVAIVGNAAEHGGAVVIASRGNMVLASEIAVSSAAQVGLFVAPAVALLSLVVRPALPLSFRPVELVAMGGAAVLVAFVVADGRSRRWEGFLLVAVYAAAVASFWVAGDR